MPFHPRARCRSVTWSWRHRFLALLLGGLFLVAFDCGALVHGADHSHGSVSTSSSSTVVEDHGGHTAAETPPVDESCPTLGLDDEGEGRNNSQPGPLFLTAAPVAAARGVALARAVPPRSRSPDWAQSGRSRLKSVCRWRI